MLKSASAEKEKLMEQFEKRSRKNNLDLQTLA